MKQKAELVRKRANKSKSARRGNRRGKQPTNKPYPPELRLKAVLLCEDKGRQITEVASELGVSIASLGNWVRTYRLEGANARLFRAASEREGVAERGEAARRRLPPPVRGQIIDIKKTNPGWGVKRIAQVMRRWFLMEASPETVRKTLNEEELIQKKRAKPKRNRSKPRRFERATPNQMWQSDIFTFRLGGRNAYLVAYLDDYSRFVVGLELFRSQTAEAVIELYRRAPSPTPRRRSWNARWRSWRSASN